MKLSTPLQYGITVAELDKANPILETEALQIGQKIIIPVKEESSFKTVAVKVAKNEKSITIENKQKTQMVVAKRSC
jgi:LysM repeat protein